MMERVSVFWHSPFLIIILLFQYMSDTYDLQRFVEAQDPVYRDVVSELENGRKTSHWMWFIFPQVNGLGSSYMAKKFAVSSKKEAADYLEHPVLGSRLRECATLVNAVDGRPALEIFGGIDSAKFRSSMTLFANVTPENEIFKNALQKYFDGEPDNLTLERMNLWEQ